MFNKKIKNITFLLFLSIFLLLTISSHAQTVCGPPDYLPPCSITDTAIHNLVPPGQHIPSWGPNTTCLNAAVTIYDIELCGNLNGAGTTVTTSDDFHAVFTLCVDASTATSSTDPTPWQHNWQTADEPSVNLWNSDHSAVMLLINSGSLFVFLWDGSKCSILRTAPGPTWSSIKFPAGTIFASSTNNAIYSIDNTNGPGIYFQKNTVNLTQNAGSVGTINIFDLTNSQCLMNSVNGYAADPARLATVTSWTVSGTTVTFNAINSYSIGQTINLSGFTGVGSVFNGKTGVITAVTGALPSQTQFKMVPTGGPYTAGVDTGTSTATTFPLNKWNGALGVDKTETVFSVALSVLNAQGSGYYMARWTLGQPGCELYKTTSGTVTNNGVLTGTIPDTPFGGAFGGKAPRGTIHDTNQPSTTYTLLSWGANNYTYGTYVDGTFFWGGGLNFDRCGKNAPDWKASTHYDDGDEVQPIPTSSNTGGYMFQIVNGVPGTSGTVEPIWNNFQTPGNDAVSIPFDGLTYRNIGMGTSTVPYFTYFCDGHSWKGFLGQGVGKTIQYHSYANPQIPRFNLAPTISPAQVGDTHLGNTNANTTDTNWPWVTSSDILSLTNLMTGPMPSALYMEGFFVAPPYYSPGNQNCVFDIMTCPLGTLGQVRRMFHNYNSRWHKAFDVQNAMAVVSQDGLYAAVPSDGMGQFGSTSNTPHCNVGAPYWQKSSTNLGEGTLVVGSRGYPNPQIGGTVGTNAGAYIYKIQSCSGACQTGAVKPNGGWPQSVTLSGITPLVDGTITWVGAPDVDNPLNTAAQNCRSNVFIVTLFRGALPVTPPTTAPVITVFTKLKTKIRGLYEKNFHPDVNGDSHLTDGLNTSHSAAF